MEKKDLKSMTLEELTAEVIAAGEKAFRAKQLYQWIHEKLAADFDEMTNLPKSLREKLAADYIWTSLETGGVRISGVDGTRTDRFGREEGEGVRRGAGGRLASRHDQGLVIMPKGDVGEWREFQAVGMHGQMGGIPAVSHEDLDAVV